MNPVVHFEMPYEDKERMSEFYTKAFGWKAKVMGPEYGGYVVVQTSATDEKGMLQESGRINGGFFKKTKNTQYPSVVIAVEDIREAMKKAKKAGATILGGMKAGEPDDIPGVGLYCSILDSEGNRVGMLQPSQRM